MARAMVDLPEPAPHQTEGLTLKGISKLLMLLQARAAGGGSGRWNLW